MKANESTLDRIVRLIVGIVLFYIGFFTLTGTAGIILGIIGIMLFITGVMGFCLLYKVFGFSTKKAGEANP